MKIISSPYKGQAELPLKLNFSFEAVFEHLESLAADSDNVMSGMATSLLEKYGHLDVLQEGFSDVSVLEKYSAEIDALLDPLFPELLQGNEIKAASIPFQFTTFKLSKRFEKILEDAGEDFELQLRNFDESNLYIMACSFIMIFLYGFKADFKRPFFFDIPDKRTGLTRHYRTMFNGDFFKVRPLDNAPEVTDEDMKYLLDNFHDLDAWKEKFPPNSYEFRGFGMVNLFDVTTDESISSLKENLLKKEDKQLDELETTFANLFGSKSVKFGFSVYEMLGDEITVKKHKTHDSYILKGMEGKSCSNFFCKGIVGKVFQNMETLAISNVDRYGELTNYNGLYKSLADQKLKSIILVPLKLGETSYGIMELVSDKAYELNSVNANKLRDIIPIFKVASRRFMEEQENMLESIIQEFYTSLHPTVKWRFLEEAEKLLMDRNSGEQKVTQLAPIVFDEVVPLYGQIDIKGSSLARNKAIRKDLIKQLNMAAEIISEAENKFKLPIYGDLLFRIGECQENVKKGLNSGDEVTLTEFLKNEIYPVFNHLKHEDDTLKGKVESYMSALNPSLKVIYEERKDYEESVTLLNEELAAYIDEKQLEAQDMFPHYFERYKTDGIDFNMYIGQSLVNKRSYNPIYLDNLRLWQLELMCEMEYLAHKLKKKLPQKLEVASLVLVHGNPMAIRFRMDEKRFDVDGAYNIRYEIIKKRIDKAMIKGTEERLTQPGKIAIVYNQDKNAREYSKYIKFLQHKKLLLPGTEIVDIEDLQGITGLKAIRVDVNYNRTASDKVTLQDIMNVIEKDTLN
jgi:hypothetical protein